MCSIVLRIGADGVFIGANRDEMLSRAALPPAAYWPGVVGGRDVSAGGTWLAMNADGVVAAVLNRTGTLGPQAGKRSRGELPVRALPHASAAAAGAMLADLDTGQYRSFNLVIADATGAFLIRGLEGGAPGITPLPAGTVMITSGEPNDVAMPRIKRHLPKFADAPFRAWPSLLADSEGPWEAALNLPARNGFGTVSASLIALPRNAAPSWTFCDGRPAPEKFLPVSMEFENAAGA